MPPSATASKIAMTRPRIMGSVVNCTVLAAVVVSVCADTPTTTSAAPNDQ